MKHVSKSQFQPNSASTLNLSVGLGETDDDPIVITPVSLLSEESSELQDYVWEDSASDDETVASNKPDIPVWTGGKSPGDGHSGWWDKYGTHLHDTSGTYVGRDVKARGEYNMADGEVSFENLMHRLSSGQSKGTYLYTRIEGNEGDNVIHGWNPENWDNYDGGTSIKNYYSNYHHRDNISGGDGDDIIIAYRGNDQLFGDGGNDVIYGGGGHDYIDGGEGDDQLFGESGNDKIIGGGGKNILVGGEGDDILIAGNEGDKLYGGTGNDLLFGGDGDDVLFTGHIDETSADTLYGGKGADTFVIGSVPEPTTHDPNHNQSNGLGEEWLEEAGNLALAKMLPGAKLFINLARGLIDGIKNMFKTEEQVVETVNPPKVSLVEILDFNPLEDKIIVPVNVEGPVTLDLQASIVDGAAFDLVALDPADNKFKVITTFYWDEASNIFPGATSISQQNTDAFIQRLKETALITGPDGAHYGLGQKIDLGLSSEDLAGLGTSKFVTFGAFGGVSMVGFHDEDRQLGTNHNDVLQAYTSERDTHGGNEAEIRNDGNDVLYGFGGDDIMAGGGGFNKLYGGEGNDTAWYGDSLSGIYVDMNNKAEDASGEYYWAWHGNSANPFDLNDEIRDKEGYDLLWSVENIYGSDHDDVIIGDEGDNVFTSGDGKDVLTGNGGADTFILNGGGNTITDFDADEGDRIEIDLDAYGMTGWFDLDHRIENGQIVLFNKLTDEIIVRYDDDGNGFDPSYIDLRSLVGNDEEGYQVVYEPPFGANTLEWFEKYGNRIDAEVGEELVTVDGTDSWDYMIGDTGSGGLTLNGGAGDDYIVGGALNQFATLNGGDGNDTIVIRKGAMITNANGGDGDDVIILDADQSSEAGFANMFGGEGSDTFVITGPGSQYGGQVIRDFEADDSIVIDLEGFGISSLDQLQIEWRSSTHWVTANGQKVISVQGVDEHFDVMQHISELTAQQSQDWGL